MNDKSTDNANTHTSQQAEKQEKRSHKKHRRCWRIMKWTSLCVIVLFAVILSIILTGTGQRFALHQADKYLDSFSIAEVSGDLQNGLILKDIQFTSEGVDGGIKQATLQLDLGCLWHRQICIDKVVLEQPQVTVDTALIPPSEDETPSGSVQKVNLPVSVIVKQVVINQLNTTIDNNQITLKDFHTALSLDNEHGLTLKPTQFNELQIITDTTANAEESNIIKSGAETQDQTTQLPDNSVVDWQTIAHDLKQPFAEKLQHFILPLAIHVDDLQANDWQYQNLAQPSDIITLSKLQLKADIVDSEANVQQLTLRSSLGDIDGSGSVGLSGDWALDFKLHADIADLYQQKQLLLSASEVNLSLSGALATEAKIDMIVSGVADATLDGTFHFNQQNNPFHISLISKSLNYSFVLKEQQTQAEQLRINDLVFNIDGDLAHYDIDLQSTLQGMQLPQSEVLLQAQGGLTQLSIAPLTFNIGKGSAKLNGDIDWQQGVRWDVKLALDQFDTRQFLEEWPAVLSGGLNTTGSVVRQKWQSDVSDIDLHGKLQRQKLQLTGSLTSSSEQLLNIPTLDLLYGKNTIKVQGELGEQSDLKVDINAPKLNGLLPHLTATLVGTAHIEGDIQQPNVTVDLRSQQVSYNDLAVRGLSLVGEVNAKERYKGKLYLSFDRFTTTGVELNRAKVSASGNLDKQEVQLRVAGEPIAGQISIYGGYDEQQQIWQGIVNRVALHSPVGNWKEDRNIKIIYNNQNLVTQVGAHCWLNKDAKLCFPQPFSVGETGRVPFKLEKLDLTMLDNFLDKNTQVRGNLNSVGEISWQPEQPFKANVKINSPLINLDRKIGYRTVKYTFSDFVVDGKIANNEADTTTNFLLNNEAPFSAKLHLSELDSLERGVSGEINLQHLKLQLINAFLAPGDHVDGEINTQLRLAGSLLAPQVYGDLKVVDITTQINGLPVNIHQGETTITFNGQRSVLRGDFSTSDKGKLTLTGDASWQDISAWQAKVSAQGDNLKLAIPSMATLSVTPDVVMEVTPDLMTLSGKVDIPWARIEVEELPESAVDVSSDMVIVTNKKVPKPSVPMRIESDIKLNIGDDVQLNAYGLKAKLQGLLSIKQQKTLGIYGTIHIIDGRYASFGQDLVVRRGNISFSGLANEPYLSEEAIRNPEAMSDSDIVAGIKVTGLASQPVVKVFSEPTMSQAEALSYIISGHGLDGDDSSTSTAVANALIGFGLSKSGSLVGSIGETFGISDLSLDTAGTGNSSQVVVSGYITPRLQVKYGVGIFESLAELTLRYRLMPKLFLQSVSGANQAIDLLYQFSF